MDIQFHGANAITIANKQTRLVIDDNLKELGASSITKEGDISIFTTRQTGPNPAKAKLVIDCPGEYEVGNLSVYGIAARSHTDEEGKESATIYKILISDLCVVVAGHIYPELSESQLETIGMVDILLIPVGGHGYTLDGVGALKLVRAIEPKLVVPTNYADNSLKYPIPQDALDDAIKVFAMEPKEKTTKLRVKSTDLADSTQLFILEKV